MSSYTTHIIKILESFADAIWSGRKTFEVRKNDRGYQTGDHVVFDVFDSRGVEFPGHAISTSEYVITYVLSGWGIKEGYVVFGIERYTDDE